MKLIGGFLKAVKLLGVLKTPLHLGYDRIALRRSWNQIFSYLIPVLPTGTRICYDKSSSGSTGTGIF